MHPTRLLADALRTDPARPLVTYYDDTTGERTELSARTFDNWVAKTANLLGDSLLLEPGARVRPRLPAHWQTMVIAHAVWALPGEVVLPVTDGAPVTAEGPDAESPAPLGAVGPAGDPDIPRDVDAEVVAQDQLPARGRAGQLVVVPLLPLSRPASVPLPPGALDYAAEVLAHGDLFAPMATPSDDDLALAAGPARLTAAELVELAREAGTRAGLAAGGRLMVTVPASAPPLTEVDELALLLAPLALGASLVISRTAAAGSDAEALGRRAQQERVSAVVAL